MRTYGKNWAFKKTATYKQRQVRLATEWDIRLDVGNELPVEEVIDNLKKIKDDVLFMACSGVERPDEPVEYRTKAVNVRGKEYEFKGTAKARPSVAGHTGSEQEHVHVCLVLLEPKARPDVLQLLRGKRKILDEYAAPRNAKFSYAGWLIHHAKPEYKIPGEPPLRLEHGTLPMDPLIS